MIQVSFFASPGGVPPAQCHCNQRPELVNEPSSSAKQVVGSSITSVWMSADLTLLKSPWFSQNRAVSVCNGSMTTRYLSLESAEVSLARLGNDSRGLKP